MTNTYHIVQTRTNICPVHIWKISKYFVFGNTTTPHFQYIGNPHTRSGHNRTPTTNGLIDLNTREAGKLHINNLRLLPAQVNTHSLLPPEVHAYDVRSVFCCRGRSVIACRFVRLGSVHHRIDVELQSEVDRRIHERRYR